MPWPPIALTSSITAAVCSSALDGMQPTLRQTPPSVAIALDQHGLHAEVGGAERGGVAAGTRAQHEHLAFDVGLAGVRRRGGGRRRGRLGATLTRRVAVRSPARGRGLWRAAPPPAARAPRRAASAVVSVRIRLPSDTLSPTLTFTSFTMPSAGDGTSIVALSDSSVTSASSAFTVSPGLDQHFDHRHVLEVADVGDPALRSSLPWRPRVR